MIRRPPRSTHCISSAASDVYKRQIPYFAFFGHDSGIRCKEAPLHMCLAMGIAATLCIGIGCFPDPLYALLPYSVDYKPYADFGHSLTQLQLLLFAALAFAVLMRTGLYPSEQNAINLDTDWLYRRLAPKILGSVMNNLIIVTNGLSAATRSCLLYTSPSPRDKRQSRMPSSA